MYTIICAGCGAELESEQSAEEILAEEQARDPEVTSVELYCQVCFAMVRSSHPEAVLLPGDASDRDGED